MHRCSDFSPWRTRSLTERSEHTSVSQREGETVGMMPTHTERKNESGREETGHCSSSSLFRRIIVALGTTLSSLCTRSFHLYGQGSWHFGSFFF